jgi:hypothetical protein
MAEPVAGSVLLSHTRDDLWITSPGNLFRSHLKHVAARKHPRWGFLVVSDADLMDAWLSRKLDVRDADVSQMREQATVRGFQALVDLIEPPELLVIVLGVKAARNEAMPEVFLEALHHRRHLNKRTWVVDQPVCRLQEGHLSFSHAVKDFLGDWRRIDLTSEAVSVKRPSLTQRMQMIQVGQPTPVESKVKPVPAPPVDLPPPKSAEDLIGGLEATSYDPSPHMNGTRAVGFSPEDLEESSKNRRKPGRWGKR